MGDTRRVMYMHTIDGKPGSFDGDQICFANAGRYDRRGIQLVASLAQIRREQRATIRFRTRLKFVVNSDRYGYAKVCVPAAIPSGEGER